MIKGFTLFLSIDECTFIADKGYDVKAVYNLIKDVYHGECVISLNKRNTKNPEKPPSGHPICEAGLACTRMANALTITEPARNTAALSNVQNQAVVHAIIRTGITAKRRADVRNV